jgi:hypothetical protein
VFYLVGTDRGGGSSRRFNLEGGGGAGRFFQLTLEGRQLGEFPLEY